MNPLGLDRLMLVGQICRLRPGVSVLDLACGKAEMLCQFSRSFGVTGVGVDIYPPLLAAAQARASELGVTPNLTFIEGDAGAPLAVGSFDVVSCIGATWIGGDLRGTLDIMKRHVEPQGWLVVGEVYWKRPPSEELAARYGQEFADLTGTLDVFEAAGVDLVEMVLSSDDKWDRYAASQWLNVSDWLRANPDHPDAPGMRAERDASRRHYLSEEREALGWGVFVGRPESVPG